MENNRDEYSVIIDIPLDLEAKQWSKCSIHRVPRKLRKVNELACTPQLISIGPFHNKTPLFQPMERLKDKYFESFRNRVKKNNHDPYEKFVQYINQNSKEIQARYAGSMIDDKEFGKIILKDSCFIIELFLRNKNKEESSEDYILTTPWLKKAIKLDFILLENQIPFDVLAKLYGFIFNNDDSNIDTKSTKRNFNDLLKLAYDFFKEHALNESKEREMINSMDATRIKHFTDLLREFWLPKNFMEEKSHSKKGNDAEEQLIANFSEHKYVYCAKKLDKAGVAFEPAPKQTSLADVKLSKTRCLKFVPGMTLKIPEVRLENDTECLLRNVIALEQCVYPVEDYICSYVILMDQLINTSDDVDFLVEKKIIANLLGSNDEAAKLFNGLCSHIPRDRCRYASYFDELNRFYENPWNVAKGALKRVYFRDLWTGSSTVVGIFVLLFTISATTRTILR